LAFEAGETGRRVRIEHPLKAWDRRYFDGQDSRLFSYVASDAEGARSASAGLTRGEAFASFALDPPTLEPLSVDQLARFFENPARGLLRGRLGVALDDEPHLVSDREPLALAPLDAYQIGDDLLRRRLRGAEPEDLLTWARSSGLLPFGTPGAVDLAAVVEDVDAVARRARPWLEGGLLDPQEVDLLLGETRLTGALRDLTARGQVLVRFGRIRPKHEVSAWIFHLALQASGVVSRTALVGRALAAERKDLAFERVYAPMATEKARALLAELLRVRELGLRAPLSFFPQASKRYVELCLREDKGFGSGQRHALEQCRKSFRDPKVFGADGDDAYVSRLFEGADPFVLSPVPFDEGGALGLPSFADIATIVFRPLLECSEVVTA
jgi:exodeoxyribonuclease V gamma subunit